MTSFLRTFAIIILKFMYEIIYDTNDMYGGDMQNNIQQPHSFV